MNSFVVLFCVVAPMLVRGNDMYDTYGGGKDDFDCSDMADGNYPDPGGNPKHCNNFYWTCTAHKATRMDCQAGLFFDPSRNWCESKENVQVCGGQEATTLPPADEVTLDPSTFDCSENEDGLYPNPNVYGCSQIYYSCSGGVAKELSCQDGLIFDPETMTCDRPENTFTCTGSRPTTIMTEPPMTRAPQTYGMDCNGMEDGPHPHPKKKCSHEFIMCSNGHASLITCAGKMYYDRELKACDSWRNVFDCSNMERVPLPDQPEPTFAPATYQKHADFDCNGMEDGSHPDPLKKCSGRYFDCTNGHTYERNCPANLIFNPDEGVCDGHDNVFACTGVHKEKTLAPTMAPTSPPRIPDYDCKEDGVVVDPQNDCSSMYFVCKTGIDSKMYCNDDLKFNIETGVCDYFENVFACSGKRPEPAVYPAPVTPPKDIPEVPIDCKTLPDGDYPDPLKECSQTFYSCSGGIGTERQCAGNLVFDPELLQCENEDETPICTGKPRPYPIPTQPPKDIEEHPFDCSKLEDANYPAGDCENHYWSCVGGITHIIFCFEGLSYDAELNLCELPKNMPTCGGERPQPVYPSKVTDLPDEPTYPVDCSKLADASYTAPGDDCTKTYYVCSHGRTTEMICPGMLKFDITRNLCDLKVHVPACGGSVPNPDTYNQDSYQPTRATKPPHDNSYGNKHGNKHTKAPLDPSDPSDYNSVTIAPTKGPLDERRTRKRTRGTRAPHLDNEDSYQAVTRPTLPPREQEESYQQRTHATLPPRDQRTRATSPPKHTKATSPPKHTKATHRPTPPRDQDSYNARRTPATLPPLDETETESYQQRTRAPIVPPREQGSYNKHPTRGPIRTRGTLPPSDPKDTYDNSLNHY